MNPSVFATASVAASSPAHWRKAILASVVALLLANGAQAALINGNFATNGGAGQLTVNTTLAGWTGGGKEGFFGGQTTPPIFVFSGNAGQTGVTGDAFMGNVKFYGVTAPPMGASFIAAAGDPDWGGFLSQTITGLSIGVDYTLSFNWAGAQQQGYSGATTEKWRVGFGSSTQTTATVNTPSQTFAGWQTASLTFTPTATSQVLKFTALGTPSGQQPWLLLSNVQLDAPAPQSAVPEPATLALVGLAGFAVFAVRRRQAGVQH